MALTWTDWRGHDYTVGDTILYARMSGRSCEMAEGVVVDLMVMIYPEGKYKWTRLPDDSPVPEKLVWQYVNPENPDDRCTSYPREGWERKQVMVPIENERRALIQPTLRTSRFNSYEARRTKWVYDEENHTGEFVDAGPAKPIRLTVTESITVPVP